MFVFPEIVYYQVQHDVVIFDRHVAWLRPGLTLWAELRPVAIVRLDSTWVSM